MPPLTIRKPETLANRLAMIEQEGTDLAYAEGKADLTYTINGQKVRFFAEQKPQRMYRLFYVGNRKVSRASLEGRLLTA